MSANNLISDIKKRKLKPVYLLHGEEGFYIDLVSESLEKNVLSEAEKGFNYSVFYGKDADLLNIINSAKRYPMMSDYQIIMVKEAQELKWGKDGDGTKAQTDPLLSYLEKPLSSTILIFCYKHGKFDKRKKTYKAIEKNGCVFESPTIYESKVPAWIETYLSEKGYQIQPRASALMAEYLGTDLSKVSNELDKLILNIPKDQEITTTDVQKNIGISKEYNVFELQGAIARRDAFKANQIIDYFGSNPKSNPIQLTLGTLNTYFGKILKYHYISDKSQQNLARELGVSPFFVKDYELAGKNYPIWKTFNIISFLRDCDLKTKGLNATGNTEHSELMKELIFKIIH